MRLLFFGILLASLVLPVAGQSSETGGDVETDGGPPAPRAQPVGTLGNPGASQDAEAAREKLLKAADQLDNIESNSEATKASLDDLKNQMTKLTDDNVALKAQVSTLQDTITHQQDQLDEIKAARLKERQALIDEVSALVAEKGGAPHHPHVAAASDDEATPAPVPIPKKHQAADSDNSSSPTSLAPPADASGPIREDDNAGADTPSTSSPDMTAAASTEATLPPSATPHSRKGYYHVVEPHETLSLICQAYRDHGVNVTIAQIRRANGMTSKSSLKVGQKLFIPKPGT